MPLTSSDLAAVQHAGQALHQASEVLSQSVRSQAQSLVALVASQPFTAESEQAMARFKTLARLGQDLQALEQQMRSLYATAQELCLTPTARMPDAALRHPMLSGTGAAESNHTVLDVVARPARRRPMAAAARAPALTPNDTKVRDYLLRVLRTDRWTALTGAAIARGTGLPLGSVGASLHKVLASGAVQKGARGTFRRAPGGLTPAP